ncbi:MAG: metallophosphoesterase [Bdellovibrionaceae bacterium]|nr:metallophosphoesterase [Pseudobdellovibrionaceae bacterium]
MNKHETYFISDLHLDHKRILEFSPCRKGPSITDHNEWLIQNWNNTVTDQDKVYVLGDVVFSQEALELIGKLKGHKYLIRGNHDKLSTQAYLKYFNNVYGILKTHGFWLTHAPIHPNELRGKLNIHGHVHERSITLPDGSLDERYINVCVEALNGIPISLTEIMKKISSNRPK